MKIKFQHMEIYCFDAHHRVIDILVLVVFVVLCSRYIHDLLNTSEFFCINICALLSGLMDVIILHTIILFAVPIQHNQNIYS